VLQYNQYYIQSEKKIIIYFCGLYSIFSTVRKRQRKWPVK
jgi:hypothetical protein